MKVNVKISTTLRKYVPDYRPETGLQLELEGNSIKTVQDLAESLGLPLGEIKFIMLNGRYEPLESLLRPDDRVAFFPAVGGG